MRARILRYPNDWRCDAGHGFDKPGGSGTTGRRYFKDDDGTFVHEVLLRRAKGGYAMSTNPKSFTRTFVVDGTKTIELLDSDRATVLATTAGHEVDPPEGWKAQWSHETYALLKQVGRA